MTDITYTGGILGFRVVLSAFASLPKVVNCQRSKACRDEFIKAHECELGWVGAYQQIWGSRSDFTEALDVSECKYNSFSVNMSTGKFSGLPWVIFLTRHLLTLTSG